MIAEQIKGDAHAYDVSVTEAASWAAERATKTERDARRLVTLRAGKLASQRRRFAETEKHFASDPRVEGIQTGAVKARERGLREAITGLGAAAHDLSDTVEAIKETLR